MSLAFVVALLPALWVRVPDLLAGIAVHISRGVTFERTKSVLAIALLFAGGLSAALAIRRLLGGEQTRDGGSAVESFCLGGACGSLLLSVVLLPALGSRNASLLLAAGLVGHALIDSRSRARPWLAFPTAAALVALAFLPFPVGSGLVGRHHDPRRRRTLRPACSR